MFRFLLLATALFSYPSLSLGTIQVPPTLEEVVDASEKIGRVRLIAGRLYEPVDEQGTIPCPSIYKGVWVDSFTGESGEVDFSSYENFEIGSVVLVYLSDVALKRKLMSTNSSSESRYANKKQRQLKCTETQSLLKTVNGTSSVFVDEKWIADVYKTGVWVEQRSFLRREFKEIVVMPTGYSIDGVELTRKEFIPEFYDEFKHQVVRTAGFNLLIFKAVNWSEYSKGLIQLIEKKQKKKLQVDGVAPPN